MNAYVALVRAVNVGGTGKLPMAELRALCESLGFESVQTYIQSGNVVFRSALSAAKVESKLQTALAVHLGTSHAVYARSAAEMHAIAAKQPFADAAPNQVLVLFLSRAPEDGAVAHVAAPGGEILHLRERELYIHFPHGMGRSKLKIPLAEQGTGRNLNTVRKLAALAAALG